MGIFGKPQDPSLPPGCTYEDIDEQFPEPETCRKCDTEVNEDRLCPVCDSELIREDKDDGE
jgi:predicted Zn-ribbon and HTH transcriptional regulator